jgi:hypothetical protein
MTFPQRRLWLRLVETVECALNGVLQEDNRVQQVLKTSSRRAPFAATIGIPISLLVIPISLLVVPVSILVIPISLLVVPIPRGIPLDSQRLLQYLKLQLNQLQAAIHTAIRTAAEPGTGIAKAYVTLIGGFVGRMPQEE